MTTITVEYLGETTTIDVDLHGHDADHHCNQILDAWLAKTGAGAELTADEDDAEDWEVRDFEANDDGRVTFRGVPYRGDDVTFTFTPSEA